MGEMEREGEGEGEGQGERERLIVRSSIVTKTLSLLLFSTRRN